MTRRTMLGTLAGSAAAGALCVPPFAMAQTDQSVAPAAEPAPAAPAPAPAEPLPFSFDWLTEEMRRRSTEPYAEPAEMEGFLAGLTYDAYRRIRFRPDHARWGEDDMFFRVHAFHPGWLFKAPVTIHEVVDGLSHPMAFSREDFEYDGDLADTVPEHLEIPSVAGFRLHAPLNRADIHDEVVVFQGASYFRALGRHNIYGLSARGLAVNTANGRKEEFPRFSEFWLERPAPGQAHVTIHAALDSQSVTGAYRFDIRPGETTEIDVTARLFLREDVAQLGVAPLTSMYLLGDNDRGGFDDFRPRVHDSEALILHTRDGDSFFRPLNNPPRLASSYLGTRDPVSFGLVQRNRDFEHYLDAGAHYERRPSLMVEPLGDWGKGTVRLVEIPSDLEGNDNIVAFWVPDAPANQGDALEFSYRLHWGMTPPGAESDRAQILRTLVGKGGVSGVKGGEDRRKFVVDFAGGTLGELPADADVEPRVTAFNGEIVETVLSRIPDRNVWRLVVEASAEAGAVVELKADVAGYGRTLSETWLYQWMKE